MKSNFVTMDIARREDGRLIIMELEDGQVSGLQRIKPADFFREFKKHNTALQKVQDSSDSSDPSDENLAWEEVRTEHIVQDEWIDFRRSAYRFPDGTVFEPYYSYSRKDYVVIVATHPEFGTAMDEAREAGVEILFLSCHVEPDEIVIISHLLLQQ